MVDLIVTKQGAGLFAQDKHGEEALSAIPDGTGLRVSISKPRNVKHHRMLFGFLDKCIDAGADYVSPKAMLFDLKVALGHCDIVRSYNGRHYVQERSIDFNAMSQKEFSEFFEAAVKLVCTKILPGVERQDLVPAALEVLEGRAA